MLIFQYTPIQRGVEHSSFAALVKGDVVGYLKNWLYFFPIELISIGILVKVLLVYRQWLEMHSLALTLAHFLRYQLAFFPAILLGIMLFCPITNAFRYIMEYAGEHSWATYFPRYFFTWPTFFNYLLPILLYGYGYININLLLDYIDFYEPRSADLAQSGIQSHSAEIATSSSVNPLIFDKDSKVQSTNDLRYSQPINVSDLDPPVLLKSSHLYRSTISSTSILRTIVVSDPTGITHLPVQSVHFFEVQGKKYVAHTVNGVYNIRKTLSELETELDPDNFYRINRSVIVNLCYVKNYSHWEYDKYVIRLTNHKSEFIMQRSHLKKLQERLDKLLQ